MSNPIPAEVSVLGLNPMDFKWSDSMSVRGPCPKCYGTRRFVLFVDRPWPSWYGMCDGCGIRGWVDQLFNIGRAEPLDKVTEQIRDLDRRVYEAMREESRNLALRDYRESRIWEQFEHNLQDEHRAWWECQGIPVSWQSFWHLGYTPSRTFSFDGVMFDSDAYTIPKFDLTGLPVNLDFRMLRPPSKAAGKYRPIPDLPASPFVCIPYGASVAGDDKTVVVVEGSKKAMVTCVSLGGRTQVIGVPSCNGWAGVPSLLTSTSSKVSKAYVIMDPDAEAWAIKLADAIGPMARRLNLPGKVDDLLVRHNLTGEVLMEMLECQAK